MAKAVVYQKFTGINNVKKAWELDLSELVEATNIDIDKSYRILLRNGKTKLLSGAYSNLWTNEFIILATYEGNLVEISPDFITATILRIDVGMEPMSYVTVNDIVVYTNNTVIGYIKEGVDCAFPLPTDTFKFSLIPGHLLEYYRGRLFIARENVIWYSDVMAKRFGSLDKRANGRQLPSRILLMKAVDDGLWLSDETAIYYASGLDPYTLNIVKVKDYPAIFGMATQVDGQLMQSRIPLIGTAYMIGTTRGVCFIGNGGFLMNITEKGYRMPQGTSGTMLFHKSDINRVISIVNS
jgi:hypothetical protein